MIREKVVLVDPADRPIGEMEKMEAHRKGVLHRAFSVLLFNDNGQLLLQRRAFQKYHSGGLWTNTCCSHPRPSENLTDATRRRLVEEMGISLIPKHLYSFTYRAELAEGLVENEYDHVFTGIFNGTPEVNPGEVADWRFADLEEITNDIKKQPDQYTPWFRLIMDDLPDRLK